MTIEKIADSRDHVIATIRKVADNANVDFSYLLNQAKIESGLNPNARTGASSAVGLYQFTSGTWLSMVRQHGAQVGLDAEAQSLRDQTATSADKAQILALRTQPEIASTMAARFALDNAKALSAAGHTAVGPTELYLAHFLGSGGATTFMNGLRDAPSQPAAASLPAAAAANTPVFFKDGTARSFREIYDRFAQKFGSETASLAKSEAIAASDAARIASKLPQGLTDSQIVKIVKSTLAAANAQSANAQTANGQQAPASVPVSEDMMATFLKGFSMTDTTPGLTPVDAPTRDASQGASTQTRDAALPAHNVEPLALGSQLILRAVDQESAKAADAAATQSNNEQTASLWKILNAS